jgi:hypothetical protein
MLWLWTDSPRPPRRLSAEHLYDIAALPHLRILRIHSSLFNDADLEILSSCNSLKYLTLRKTAVTALGELQLSAALPECVVDRE